MKIFVVEMYAKLRPSVGKLNYLNIFKNNYFLTFLNIGNVTKVWFGQEIRTVWSCELLVFLRVIGSPHFLS